MALLAHAQDLSTKFRSLHDAPPPDKPIGLEVTNEQAQSLATLLKHLVPKHQALVELGNLKAETIASEKVRSAGLGPWIERLDEYPAGGVDLTNLVAYPPRLRPVPVKPIFLDVAFNYINYPSADGKKLPSREAQKQPVESAKQETRKSGWFGFGR